MAAFVLVQGARIPWHAHQMDTGFAPAADGRIQRRTPPGRQDRVEWCLYRGAGRAGPRPLRRELQPLPRAGSRGSSWRISEGRYLLSGLEWQDAGCILRKNQNLDATWCAVQPE